MKYMVNDLIGKFSKLLSLIVVLVLIALLGALLANADKEGYLKGEENEIANEINDD